jgi:hypothetical protein
MSEFDERIILTLAALRMSLADQQRPPVIYSILAPNLPASQASFVRLANDGATPIGYDIVCHPDQLPALQATVAGIAVLLPRGDTAWRRRVEKMLEGWHTSL